MRLFACLTLFLAPMGGLAAHPTEYDLLRRVPPEFLAALTSYGEPDAAGFVGAHRKNQRWLQAGRQRSGCWYLIGAVVAGDKARADQAWTSVAATFARQEPDGGFVATQQPNRDRLPTYEERVETAFFYLQELGHALLVIEQSPLASHFRARLDALRPAVRRAIDYVLAGHHTIVAKVGRTTNRLLIAAKAYGLCGVWLDYDRAQDAARELVGLALQQRDDEGVFLEYGGRDSSYNAVSLLMGRVLWLHLPIPGLGEALERAMPWQLSRIRDDGTVLADGNTRTGLGQERNLTGGAKGINRREVALALCYHGLLRDDPATLALAQKVFPATEQDES